MSSTQWQSEWPIPNAFMFTFYSHNYTSIDDWPGANGSSSDTSYSLRGKTFPLVSPPAQILKCVST